MKILRNHNDKLLEVIEKCPKIKDIISIVNNLNIMKLCKEAEKMNNDWYYYCRSLYPDPNTDDKCGLILYNLSKGDDKDSFIYYNESDNELYIVVDGKNLGKLTKEKFVKPFNENYLKASNYSPTPIKRNRKNKFDKIILDYTDLLIKLIKSSKNLC